ncbi:hypothetical protein H8959_008088 [Pygathrix nigripes]
MSFLVRLPQGHFIALPHASGLQHPSALCQSQPLAWAGQSTAGPCRTPTGALSSHRTWGSAVSFLLQRWTETYVRWSPKGTYLATFHQRGIALWGGEKFKQIQRFSHQGVQLIDFSPCERYLVTFSPLMDTQDDPQAIIIWDILTGHKKRGFHCESSAHWPIFKWSHDGKFFARMTLDTLSIYETPSMGLLDKKSLKISGIKDFSWSPGGNIIAFWVPEDKDIPARVTLMQLPTRQEIRVRNLFNVVDCKLHWQKNGDYLCVKVDRTPKGTQAAGPSPAQDSPLVLREMDPKDQPLMVSALPHVPAPPHSGSRRRPSPLTQRDRGELEKDKEPAEADADGDEGWAGAATGHAKRKTSQMEKLLPRRVTGQDQWEVLRLLCRTHELEVESTELQADNRKDFVIQRYHQHRLLCEQLIQEQR